MTTIDHESEDSGVAALVEEPVGSDETASRSGTQHCVLFATNGSAEAEAALHFATALARRVRLPLRVLTVLEPLPAIPAQPAGASYHFGVEMERGERILNMVREELSANGMRDAVTTSMLVGSVGTTIAEAARDWRAEYIVLGAGRHGALERMLAGDTVVRVMRHAPAPVIAVPAECQTTPHNGVAAVDFGPASFNAARAAASIIGTGVLHLVHVRPEIDLPATDPEGWSAIYESGARSLLTQLADELHLQHPGLRTDVAIRRGHTPTTLLDYVNEVGADFVAAGQHSRGVVDRVLFGSVANALVRGARCGVLVAPA
jgi:nucleotide-binding universal stress UspA family protein